jgi:hypothetical protein
LDYRTIKSGQKYYFDNSKDLAKEDNKIVKLYTGTKDWVIENRDYEGASKGYVTAGRDGFIFGHYHEAGGWADLDTIDSTLKLDIGDSGSYEIFDNNKIKGTEGHSFAKDDFLLYDKATGNHNYYVFTGAGMDASASIAINSKKIEDVIVLSGDAYVNKNIFVNGIKILSGTLDELESPGMEVEYTWGNHDINGVTTDVSIISTSGFSNYTLGFTKNNADGGVAARELNDLSLLQFVPHVTESFTGFTGAGRVDYDIGLAAASEQLWFNGQRSIPPKSEFSSLTVTDVTVSYMKVNKDGLGNAVPQTYLDFTTNVSSLNDVHQSHPFLTRIFDQEFKFGFDVSVPPTGEKYFAMTPV